ncbi:alpha/beta-hydrolase [Macrolepiota fuliginosa MF-IS2]|uniref:Alpha/beta-hydrolase n=1 Tax=Macrolepiota fuliginosa MF-IS2 TaxID=1400762 RepID=A0A9P5XD11_9AGAR|nr:alpha/beta-hydrolase [Macrolepiota fuliginosa MF-IS2]
MSKHPNSLQRGLSRLFVAGLFGLALSYFVVVSLVMVPIVQTYITYAHHVHTVGHSTFERPEDHGLAPGKAVNMKLQSSDNTTLGAWFIFAESIHQKTPLLSPSQNQPYIKIPSALNIRPTILFLHGNTGSRALPLRITVYTGLTARLDANLFAVDYRGFGDSAGHPSVEGVARDARAAWDYLMLQGAKPRDVLIVGHSLGTAIASLLAANLASDGIEPRGLVLMSAFSSLRTLMDQYYLFGFLPLLKPLSAIPLAPRLLTWSLKHRFDSLALVPHIKTSVLLAHGENDWDISHTHTSSLFDAFLDPYLPPVLSQPEISMSSHDWDEYPAKQELRAQQRNTIVKTTAINRFGTLEEFVDQKENERRVVMLKTHAGGHDIGRLEGVQDVIGKMFGFH